jgi:exodeoxyribonuclease V alpha subunit
MPASAPSKTRSSSSVGRGWSLLAAPDDGGAPDDPHETRVVVSLTGAKPRFVSADESFAIWNALRKRADGSEQGVTLKGALARCGSGESLSCKGAWKKHPQHGYSFQVESYESALPTSAKGIKLWLSRKQIPGIGPTFAEAIVDHFGADKVYDILDTDPERLREVRTKKGRAISAKQVEKAIAAWDDYRAIRQIETFLFSLGVPAGLADKLYRTYGEDVVEILQTDPYRISELGGVGFKTADDIAIAMGVPLDDPNRVRAGIMYILNEAEGDGHTFLYLKELFARVSNPRDAARDRDKGLGVSDKRVVAAQATKLATERKLVAEETTRVDSHGEMEKTQKVYSRRMYEMEIRLARKVRELNNPPAGPLFPMPERPVAPEGLSKDEVDALRLPSDDQWSVVDLARTSRLALLTGGPGVGKSQTQATVVELVKQSGRVVRLCAPTGKAARRMTELTGEGATTVHRLLEFNPMEGGFQRGEGNPVEADLVILDEASMMSLDLADSFFKAIGPKTHVLLVGDPDQLPPVGAGKVLHDLIDSGAVPRVHLNKVFRQAAASMIVTAARMINAGQMPITKHEDAERILQRSMLRDFFFLGLKGDGDDSAKLQAEILDKTLDYVCNRIPRTFKTDAGQPMDPVRDIMVLAPMRKGAVGLDSLNKALESRLNPGPGGEAKKPIVPTRGICVGSRIVQHKNDYTPGREIMNGEIALVLDYRESEQEALLSLDDGAREVWVPVGDMDTFHLAWAMSVHKSQGSEFPCVVAPMSYGYYTMLKRALVYTAVTRAKKVCLMIGERRALAKAVKDPESAKRNSSLVDRILDPALSGELF